MDLSLQLARIIGPLFLLVGVAGALNARYYRRMVGEFLKNSGLLYFSGVLAFAIGLALVLHHNIWTADWRLIITLIGWVGLVRGAVRLLLPHIAVRTAESLMKQVWLIPVGAGVRLVIGAILIVYGFEILSRPLLMIP